MDTQKVELQANPGDPAEDSNHNSCRFCPQPLPRPVQALPNTHGGFLLNFLVNCTSNA